MSSGEVSERKWKEERGNPSEKSISNLLSMSISGSRVRVEDVMTERIRPIELSIF